MNASRLLLCCSFLAAALLAAGDGAAAPVPAPRGGVLVLDNCDPDYRGKDEYADNLSSIDGFGQVVFRVSGLNNCESMGSNHMVALDAKRGWVWVAENVGHRVRKYDRASKELLVLRDVRASALAVDPENGDLWAITSTGGGPGRGQTVVFDAAGRQRASHAVGGFDIAYDAKSRAFWVAGLRLAKVQGGRVVLDKPIAPWHSVSVAVSPASGAVWVAVRDHPGVRGSKNELLGFDNDGALRHQVALGADDPFRVSVGPKDGAVWLTLRRRGVRRYTADGKPDGEYGVTALAAEADGRTGGVWVVTPDETLHLSRRWEVTFRVKHKGPTSQAWLAAW
jgi:hypothetical protein